MPSLHLFISINCTILNIKGRKKKTIFSFVYKFLVHLFVLIWVFYLPVQLFHMWLDFTTVKMDIEQLINEIIHSYDEHLALRGKQREALLHIVSLDCTGLCTPSTDTIICLPTGYGKSLLPILLNLCLAKKLGRNCSVLVLSPLNKIQQEQLLQMDSKKFSYC